MRVEEQDRIEEVEHWERLETQAVGDTLREEYNKWEKGKSSRKTTREPCSGRSTKRDVRELGGTGRRKKLKYELIEDDWGAAKMTLDAPGTDTNGGGLLKTPELPTMRREQGARVWLW